MTRPDTRARATAGPWSVASFGVPRFCLLILFVVVSLITYFYIDSHTLYRFLTQVQEDRYGSLPTFTVVYIISVVVLFPCMIMQVLSGALYGFWMGMLVSWIATNVGQVLAFVLGRYLFRPTVKAYLYSTWPSFPAIDSAIKKEGWRLVCLLRLSPILPYNILNYALAITPVSIYVFAVASAFATLPWTALYVYLGTFSNNLKDLTQGKISYGRDAGMLRKVASGIFIVVTAVYGYHLSHRAISTVLKDAADHLPQTTNSPSALNSSTEVASLDKAHGSSGNVASNGLISLGGIVGSSSGSYRQSVQMLSSSTDRGTLQDAELGKG